MDKRLTLKIAAVFIAGIIGILSVAGCAAVYEAPQPADDADVPVQTANETYVTDPASSGEHEEITTDLIMMVEHNPELKSLLEKSIIQAYRMNPDPDTNPVSDLESCYAFVDFCYKCMPWEICPSVRFVSLYDRIDQGMGCLYFICNQPLEELKDYDYYHNSLMYHEPFRSWFIRFLSGSGQYLSTDASWNDTYYQNALGNPDFHLDDDTYESHDNWRSFNDFFARRLKDPSKRPGSAPDDNSVIISPADSVPQGVWKINKDNKVVGNDAHEETGIII